MTQDERVEMLKIALQLMTDAFDSYLEQLLGAAEAAITQESGPLKDTILDEEILRRYAAYLYSKRTPEGEQHPEMPRDLRWMLNNRYLEWKAGGGADAS